MLLCLRSGLLARAGFRHGFSLRTVFRDRHGCWAFLDLWRSDAAPPFSDAELSVLAEDVPAITTALRTAGVSPTTLCW